MIGSDPDTDEPVYKTISIAVLAGSVVIPKSYDSYERTQSILSTYGGRVNSEVFLAWPAGTVVFLGGPIKERIARDGTVRWDCEWRFEMQQNMRNMYWGGTRWAELPTPYYDSADFNVMFAIKGLPGDRQVQQFLITHGG